LHALVVHGSQYTGFGQYRALVDMYQFETGTLLTRRQLLGARVQPLTRLLRRQFLEHVRCDSQIPDDQRIAIARVPGQGQDQRQAAAPTTEATGNMYQRAHLLKIRQGRYPMLVAQLIEVVVQARLGPAGPPGDGERGPAVGPGTVR